MSKPIYTYLIVGFLLFVFGVTVGFVITRGDADSSGIRDGLADSADLNLSIGDGITIANASSKQIVDYIRNAQEKLRDFESRDRERQDTIRILEETNTSLESGFNQLITDIGIITNGTNKGSNLARAANKRISAAIINVQRLKAKDDN